MPYYTFVIMKKYKITALILLLIVFLVGCSNPTIPENNVPESVLPNENNEEIPNITPPNTPENDNQQNEQPPSSEKPSIPTNYDSLIQIKANSLKLYANKKLVGTVYKNDLLPLIKEDKKYYITIFNYNTVYIEKNNLVSIKKLTKVDKKTESIIETAQKTIGTKYVYGAERYHYNGIKNSKFNKYFFDCSSLTQYAFFVGANIKIGANSRMQATEGTVVKKSAIKRGDLMFFTNSSRKNNTGIERIGHVGIYLGDNLILHTSSDYAIIEPISNSRWNNYIYSRRYF